MCITAWSDQHNPTAALCIQVQKLAQQYLLDLIIGGVPAAPDRVQAPALETIGGSVQMAATDDPSQVRTATLQRQADCKLVIRVHG